jgi:zona occludens toxin
VAIDLYSGLPGSGKSFGVVKHVILPALKAGRLVVTNIPLYLDTIKEEYPEGRVEQFSSDDDPPYNFSQAERGAVVVIDEAWRHWPGGMRANAIPEADRAFFAEHRHRVDEQGRSTQIVLVTQNPAQISTFVREMINTHYRAEKMDKLGSDNKFRIDVYADATTKKAVLIRSMYGAYTSDVWKYYQSHTQGEAVGVDESSMDNRGNVFASATVRYGLPIGVIFVVFGVYYAYTSIMKIAGGAEEIEPGIAERSEALPGSMIDAAESDRQIDLYRKKHEAANIPVEPKSGQPLKRPRAPRIKPDVSDTWRIAGVIERDGAGLVLIWGRSRYRQITMDTCFEIMGTAEYECEYEGERITYWSGEQDKGFSLNPVEEMFQPE